MSDSPRQLSASRFTANRANTARSTGSTTPEDKAHTAKNARKHVFTAASFAVVRLENLDEVAHLKTDLVAVYQPVNSQEIALAQQALSRAARLESGLFTTCLNEVLDSSSEPFVPMSTHLAGDGDIEITRAQNRNYALAEGFHRMEEFERLKGLRAELPNEPILESQANESEVNATSKTNPKTNSEGTAVDLAAESPIAP